jgi:hypothetical protein
MRTHLALAAVLGSVLFTSCTLVDLRVQPDRNVRNRALVTGFVSAGWPEDDSVLKLGLFKAPNHGSLLYLQVWKLLRIDIGIVGLAVGVGPLDAGLGVLLHKPRPPRYCDDDHDADCCDSACDDCDNCDDCDDCEGEWVEEWEEDVDDDEHYSATFMLPPPHVHHHQHRVIVTNNSD